MAQVTVKNENTLFTVKHRGICSKNNYHWKGPWRIDYNHAVKDTLRHYKQTKHTEIWVETKQTTIMTSKVKV